MRPTQVYSNTCNVLDAARQRVSFIFDNFEDIKVSVSGGKDSTVLAHLMLMEAKRRQRKIGVFFLDEEVVYQSTIDQVSWLIEDIAPDNVIPLWLQIEFDLTNSTSFEENHLTAWEPGKHDLWMRPKKSYAIKFAPWDREKQIIHDKNIGLNYYAVIDNFEHCYNNAAFTVGLRGTEHPNRWRAVSKNPVTIGESSIYWASPKGDNFAMYPIFDWNIHDVWKYIFEQKLRYSKIYDYMFKKGMPINEMRTSSLIHEKSFKSICELPEFEPKTYNRLVKRIKGIQFAQETGKSAKMFNARQLPKNFKSWLTYRDFLLETYPDSASKHVFETRFARHLNNEWVARQQCRQLVLNDIGNFVPVESKPDPREELIAYYRSVL